MSLYKDIKEFIENSDEPIDRIVVPGDEWDEIKEKAETVDNGGFDIETTINGVTIVWSNRKSEAIAQVPINE